MVTLWTHANKGCASLRNTHIYIYSHILGWRGSERLLRGGERTSDLMPLVMPLGDAKPSSGEVRAVAVAHVCDQDDALDYARVCVCVCVCVYSATHQPHKTPIITLVLQSGGAQCKLTPAMLAQAASEM